MRRRLLPRSCVTALSCAFAVSMITAVGATPAWAHGGVYRGPAGEIPPDSREPTDPPPPPPGASGAAGVSGGPETGPSVGGQPRIRGYQDWTFWWELQKDDVLAAVVADRRQALSPDVYADGVVPALRGLLERPDVNFDISSAAAIALARMGDRSITPLLRTLAAGESYGPKDRSDRPHRVLCESAALALGLMNDGHVETEAFLRDMASTRSNGGDFRRPWAALALALRGATSPDEKTAAALRGTVAGNEPKWNVKPAAIVALGQVAGASVVDDLVRIARGEPLAEDGKKPRRDERAAAAMALGFVQGDDEIRAADALIGIATSDKERPLRRAAVVALGRLAGRSHKAQSRDILNKLTEWMASPESAMEPEHLVQALGVMAAESEAGSRRRGAVVALLGALVSGAPTPSAQATAAVCLGIAERGVSADQRGSPAPLRRLFVSAKDPHVRAAAALSLGLVGDVEAASGLRQILKTRTEPAQLRGYCALALGLLGGADDAPMLAKAAREAPIPVRIQATAALGLVGGEVAKAQLLSVFVPGADEESFYVFGEAARALGAIGGADLLDPLLKCAGDEKNSPDYRRAVAAAAIGLICERADAPSLRRLTAALPPRTGLPAFLELLTIL